MSIVAAFDLSLNSSGICILDMEKGTPLHYESVSSDLEGISRLYYNYNRYMNILSAYRDVSIIAFEEQNNQMRFSYSAGSIISLAENVGVFKIAMYQNIPKFSMTPIILGIPAQDIKKFATDNGKATKEEMIAAVNGNHLRSIKRDIPEHSINDVADAYHLARMSRTLVLEDKDYSMYLAQKF